MTNHIMIRPEVFLAKALSYKVDVSAIEESLDAKPKCRSVGE
jgi:hypothetical protein